MSSLRPTTPDLPIWDVLIGTGTTINAFPARIGTSSMLMEFVCPLVTFVPLTTQLLELALHVSKDFLSIKEFAHLPPLLNLLMLDVELGIGTIKSAFHALKTGFSLTTSVSQLVTNALPSMSMETVSPVTKATTSREENVSSKT